MVILRDAAYVDVEGLVRYVYRGEVDVEPKRLQSFLRTAEVLKIKGLADQNISGGSAAEEIHNSVGHHHPQGGGAALKRGADGVPSFKKEAS